MARWCVYKTNENRIHRWIAREMCAGGREIGVETWEDALKITQLHMSRVIVKLPPTSLKHYSYALLHASSEGCVSVLQGNGIHVEFDSDKDLADVAKELLSVAYLLKAEMEKDK